MQMDFFGGASSSRFIANCFTCIEFSCHGDLHQSCQEGVDVFRTPVPGHDAEIPHRRPSRLQQEAEQQGSNPSFPQQDCEQKGRPVQKGHGSDAVKAYLKV